MITFLLLLRHPLLVGGLFFETSEDEEGNSNSSSSLLAPAGTATAGSTSSSGGGNNSNCGAQNFMANLEGALGFNQSVSCRSCVNSKVRWLMFKVIRPQLESNEHLIAAQWILCHCHKQLPYDRNWWSRIERQYGELSITNPDVARQVKLLNNTLHSFTRQLISATSAVRKYIDGIDPVTNTLRKRDWNASTSLSEWISGDRGLLIKKLANSDPDVRHIKPYLPDCLCEENLKEALHNGGILIYTEQFPSCNRVKRLYNASTQGARCSGVAIDDPDDKGANRGDDNNNGSSSRYSVDSQQSPAPIKSKQLNLVRPGAADTRMLDITLMDGVVLPVRRSRCSLGIPAAFVSDPVVIPKICVYDFSNGLHLYIFYRGHKMGKRKRPRFYVAEQHHLVDKTTSDPDMTAQPDSILSQEGSCAGTCIASSGIRPQTVESVSTSKVSQNSFGTASNYADDEDASFWPQEKRCCIRESPVQVAETQPEQAGVRHSLPQETCPTDPVLRALCNPGPPPSVGGLPSKILAQLLPGFTPPPDMTREALTTSSSAGTLPQTPGGQPISPVTASLLQIPALASCPAAHTSGVSAIHRNPDSARQRSHLNWDTRNKSSASGGAMSMEPSCYLQTALEAATPQGESTRRASVPGKGPSYSTSMTNGTNRSSENLGSNGRQLQTPQDAINPKTACSSPPLAVNSPRITPSTPPAVVPVDMIKPSGVGLTTGATTMRSATTAIPVQTVFVGPHHCTYLFNASLVIEVLGQSPHSGIPLVIPGLSLKGSSLVSTGSAASIQPQPSTSCKMLEEESILHDSNNLQTTTKSLIDTIPLGSHSPKSQCCELNDHDHHLHHQSSHHIHHHAEQDRVEIPQGVEKDNEEDDEQRLGVLPTVCLAAAATAGASSVKQEEGEEIMLGLSSSSLEDLLRAPSSLSVASTRTTSTSASDGKGVLLGADIPSSHPTSHSVAACSSPTEDDHPQTGSFNRHQQGPSTTRGTSEARNRDVKRLLSNICTRYNSYCYNWCWRFWRFRS